MTDSDTNAPVVLITGAARRIGRAIAEQFHARGYRVALHHRTSGDEAVALVELLNDARRASAIELQASLDDITAVEALPARVLEGFGRLDVLVNNASTFSPTPFGAIGEQDWGRLMDANVKGPFFLAQAAAAALTDTGGSIVNIVDIYGERPLKGYPVYSMSKAALAMMTKALARELGPAVRVNGIAPGAILWPEGDNEAMEVDERRHVAERTALERIGDPSDIARTAWFLAAEAPYVTGQILAVDGGRSVNC